MSIGALNDVAAAAATVTVPGFGAWWADVDLVEALELSKGAPATLTLADVTVSGVVASGGVVSGKGSYRILGGRGGLGRTVKRKPYHDDAGVKVSTVLGDLLRDAGETAGPMPTARLGPHYARREEPAYLALNHLTARAWFVDFAGVVQVGARPRTELTIDATRTEVDPRAGSLSLATETLAGVVPGVVIDDREPATDVEYVLEKSRLTARVYSRTRLNARVSALRDLVAGLFPALAYAGSWEYRVVSQTGERFNLQAVRNASGMPDLARVPVRPGMAGLKAKLKLGSLVLVCFADNDPSRPGIVAHDAVGAPGWMPVELQLGDDPALGVARHLDPVQAGPFAGVITQASGRVKSGL